MTQSKLPERTFRRREALYITGLDSRRFRTIQDLMRAESPASGWTRFTVEDLIILTLVAELMRWGCTALRAVQGSRAAFQEYDRDTLSVIQSSWRLALGSEAMNSLRRAKLVVERDDADEWRFVVADGAYDSYEPTFGRAWLAVPIEPTILRIRQLIDVVDQYRAMRVETFEELLRKAESYDQDAE
jgi:hypothetical protein